MTAEKFRSIALRIPGAVESAHQGHPDFRLNGKIFATLGYPDEKWAMVRFTPEQQRKFLKRAPSVFEPASGAWGRSGSTHVRLAAAGVGLAREALELAKENVTGKTSV